MKVTVLLFFLVEILSVKAEGQAPSAPDPRAMIQKPPVSDNCRQIIWAAVKGATGYTFSINRNSWNTTDNATLVCDLQMKNGENLISIVAHFADGNTKAFADGSYSKMSEDAGCELFKVPDGCGVPRYFNPHKNNQPYTGNRIPLYDVAEFTCGGYKIQQVCNDKKLKIWMFGGNRPPKYQVPSPEPVCLLAKGGDVTIKNHSPYKNHPLANDSDILIAKSGSKIAAQCRGNSKMRVNAMVRSKQTRGYMNQYEIGREVGGKEDLELMCHCKGFCAFVPIKPPQCRTKRRGWGLPLERVCNHFGLYSDSPKKPFKYALHKLKKKLKVNRVFGLKCSP